jgi:hypothetical protein
MTCAAGVLTILVLLDSAGGTHKYISFALNHPIHITICNASKERGRRGDRRPLSFCLPHNCARAASIMPAAWQHSCAKSNNYRIECENERLFRYIPVIYGVGSLWLVYIIGHCKNLSQAYGSSLQASRARSSRSTIWCEQCMKDTVEPLLWYFLNGFMGHILEHMCAVIDFCRDRWSTLVK